MTDRHEHLDEGTLHAWLDGALPHDESARVEAQATTCSECASLVAEARGLIAASSRILSSLDAVPAGVIPGSDVRVDQLAALRARRRATTRRWWGDRRVVAAASLLFVAGAASVVWRSLGNQPTGLPTAQTVVAPSAAPDSARPGSSDLRSATTTAVREAPARDGKAEPLAPLRDPRPVRVASAPAGDSAAVQKVAGTSAPLARGAEVVANEARRIDSSSIVRSRQELDSLRVSSRVAQTTVPESQLRQQGAAAATQRQGFEQARADVQRPAAPPAALGGARLGAVVTTGLGARMAAVPPAGSCYRVRLGPPTARQVVADTVRLLGEMIPVLSDPSWFQARSIGAVPDTMLMWRSVDSITVELRSRNPSDSLAVQFNTTSRPVPEVRLETGVRGVAAVRVDCP